MADVKSPMTQVIARSRDTSRPLGITREYYRVSLGYATANGMDVFRWSGTDLSGDPLEVAWARWPDGDLWIYWTT